MMKGLDGLWRVFGLLTLAVVLNACFNSGNNAAVDKAVQPETEEQQSARRVWETTERRRTELHGVETADLVGNVPIDTNLLAFVYDGTMWSRLLQLATDKVFETNTLFLTYRRAGYWYSTEKNKDFVYSDDPVLRAYEEQTLTALGDMYQEINGRLIRTIHLYDLQAPSPSGAFPYLVERGHYGERNTLAYYTAFKSQVADMARADVAEVLEALNAGAAELPYELLNDPDFWRSFVAQGGLIDDAKTLDSLLASVDFLPLTAPSEFDAVSRAVRAQLNYGISDVDFLAWTDGLAELLEASPGKKLIFSYSPFNSKSGLKDWTVEGKVVATYKRGVSRAVKLSIWDGDGLFMLFQCGDYLFGNLYQADHHYVNYLFERQGDDGFYTDILVYRDVVFP